MYEIFLFINPIGIYCYDIEKQIQDTIKELDVDACYHFVPITNINAIKEDVFRRRKESQNVIELSKYTMATTRALQDYHAIKLAYGNKKARKFIFTLQQKLCKDCSQYNIELPGQVIDELSLNLKKINSVKDGDYINDSIHQDQKLAEQWNITKTPTTVIFKENDESCGILLEGTLKHDDLVSLLIPERKIIEQPSFCDKMFSNNHLRLI